MNWVLWLQTIKRAKMLLLSAILTVTSGNGVTLVVRPFFVHSGSGRVRIGPLKVGAMAGDPIYAFRIFRTIRSPGKEGASEGQREIADPGSSHFPNANVKKTWTAAIDGASAPM
jgi:hypothetical protein